ncbi:MULTISPECIES: helix-hairpin-helix domain-containing protein [Butyricimonas]|uniref:helix-hairpin-helix domain-containing protein n=1 Tax=Butyricimonas TaxID=574697 RepID=UPI0007FB3FD6|nr:MULTISPECIES: helix-hairpin-helix domain-containing protein [Butyricimonas]
MCKTLLFGVLLVFPFFLHAQEITDIEKLLQDNDVEASEGYYEDIVATLLNLAAHPININSAPFDSLKMLFFLSDAQIDNLLEFREKHGAFMHPNEVLLVTGIGTRDLENIKPFIRIGAYTPGATRFPRLHHEILARVKTTRPKQAGYKRYSRDAFLYEKDYLTKKRNRFQGPPVSTLLKYKTNAGTRWQGGITLENDAGENYFTKKQKTGFDFLSAHLCFTPGKIIQRICIGDYKIQWGQGLIAWGGFSSSKSSASLSNEKSGNGIMPYFSTDENRFLRGGAISLHPSQDMITEIFVSCKKTDGNLLDADTLTPEALQTATLYETGYHRNTLELGKKHTLKEFTTGLSTRFNHRYFRAGVQVLHYNFSPALAIGKAAYQQYNDPGRHRTLVSIDYKTGVRHFFLFGETARSDNGSWATIDGLRYTGFLPVALCILYRRYDKRFRSHYNSGFAEYSNTSNEEGVYVGVESSPFRNLKLNAYYDYFRFFAPRYQASLPGNGNEFAGELTYSHSRWECNFRFKHEGKPEDYKAEKLISVTRVKQEYRLQFIYTFPRHFKLQSRATHARYTKQEKKESGFLVYQDFAYTSLKENFKAQFRFAYFDTDGYNARIYAYEHNVLYGYSFPAYQDRGIRSYVNINWKPNRNITLYLKTGITYYPDKTLISSSLSRVDDNKLFDLTFQIRIKI